MKHHAYNEGQWRLLDSIKICCIPDRDVTYGTAMQGFGAVKAKDLTLLQDAFILVASVKTCQLYIKCMTIPYTEFEKRNANRVGRLECT